MSAKLGKFCKLEMLINPKKLLRRERQLKAVIGMSGKEFKILHKQFDKLYKSVQEEKPRRRGIGGGRQGVIKDTKSKLLSLKLPQHNYSIWQGLDVRRCFSNLLRVSKNPFSV